MTSGATGSSPSSRADPELRGQPATSDVAVQVRHDALEVRMGGIDILGQAQQLEMGCQEQLRRIKEPINGKLNFLSKVGAYSPCTIPTISDTN